MKNTTKITNNLAKTNPQLAKQWHPTKNGNLKPTDVTSNSKQKVWWYYPYDDHKTGKHFDFEWEATIESRNRGMGCPYLSGHAIYPGFNDLATVNPKLAAEWHPTKNGNLTPEDVTANSNRKIWWYLPYNDPNTGKTFYFEWEAMLNSRNFGNGCPYLSGRIVWYGFNDLGTVNPELAAQWHPTKNFPLTPGNVTARAHQKVWWYLPYDDPKTGKHFNFEWEATVLSRSYSSKCPFLTNQAVWPGFNDLVTTHPDIAAEWHPTKNGELKPEDVVATSDRKVWWQISYTNLRTNEPFCFDWEETISSRTQSKDHLVASKKYIHQYFETLTAKTLGFVNSQNKDFDVSFTMTVEANNEINVNLKITPPPKTKRNKTEKSKTKHSTDKIVNSDISKVSKHKNADDNYDDIIPIDL